MSKAESKPNLGKASRRPILGTHPAPPHPFGEILLSEDGKTRTNLPHRALTENDRAASVTCLTAMIKQHHVSPEALKRSEEHHEAMKRLGLGAAQAKLRRFPTNPATQKGNLAEIVLAEYLIATGDVAVPVYRLRYNPNIDQSMKGDDVLAFDLDANPVRIVVGEAKFRGASSAAVVKEIVEALARSQKAGVPVSLQFVADRLFEMGQIGLGKRVLDCARLYALQELKIDYVGMLMSDGRAAERVRDSTPSSLRQLAMISLGIDSPDSLVDSCYGKLR